jgi:adenosylcobinamide-GDP ribazoletransferase
MIRRLLAAVQFLTVVPVRGTTAAPGDAAVFFPLIGAALGLAAGFLLEFSRQWLAPGLAAAVPVAFLALATGGLHEDGLADVADALRAGRTREKMHAILKDSRIGTYGALAITLVTLVRWQAVETLALPVALTAAVALSRATLVAVAAFSKPAGDGLGAAFVQAQNPGIAIACVVQGAMFCMIVAWKWTPYLLIACAALVLASRTYFDRRLGGVTGDCLGAAGVVSECVYLVILACPVYT